VILAGRQPTGWTKNPYGGGVLGSSGTQKRDGNGLQIPDNGEALYPCLPGAVDIGG